MAYKKKIAKRGLQWQKQQQKKRDSKKPFGIPPINYGERWNRPNIKHVVLGLIFLKFASDKFEKRKQELIEEGKKQYIDMVEVAKGTS